MKKVYCNVSKVAREVTIKCPESTDISSLLATLRRADSVLYCRLDHDCSVSIIFFKGLFTLICFLKWYLTMQIVLVVTKQWQWKEYHFSWIKKWKNTIWKSNPQTLSMDSFIGNCKRNGVIYVFIFLGRKIPVGLRKPSQGQVCNRAAFSFESQKSPVCLANCQW